MFDNVRTGEFFLFARALYTQTDGRASPDLSEDNLGLDDKGLGFGAGVTWHGFVLGLNGYTGDLARYRVWTLGYRMRL